MSVRANNSMRLDRENARFLGVCAGLARWLDVPVSLVRIVFIIATLAWPPMIAGYFIAWFCLDQDFTPTRLRDHFSDSASAEHFRRIDYRKPIYRNQRNRRIAGVCAGIADYLEISAFSVRAVFLVSLFFFGPFSFFAYILCWFVLEPDPDFVRSGHSRRQRRHAKRAARRSGKVRKAYRNSEEAAGFQEQAAEAQYQTDEDGDAESETAAGAARYSRSECTQAFSELELRLREIEAFMTSKKFRLHCEINRI